MARTTPDPHPERYSLSRLSVGGVWRAASPPRMTKKIRTTLSFLAGGDSLIADGRNGAQLRVAGYSTRPKDLSAMAGAGWVTPHASALPLLRYPPVDGQITARGREAPVGDGDD
jgi:hypothetical protein